MSPNGDNTEHVAEHVEAVVVEQNAIELMERANIDIQIATAHRYPRSIAQFVERAKNMVSVDVETAESCIYRRPVGFNGTEAVYAEGESIRLAEIVAASYGNIRVSGMIIEMAPTYVKAVGFAHDLETNFAAKAEAVESTVKKPKKDRKGNLLPPEPYDERMRVVVAKAAQSKAMRDAIFRVVPKSMCKSITNIAREVISGKQRPLEERRKQVEQWLAKLPIDKERVLTALKVHSVGEMGNEQLEILTGIRTALKEGDTTLDEAFPVITFSEKKEATDKKISDAAGSKPVDMGPKEGAKPKDEAEQTTTGSDDPEAFMKD